jgi:hypothetical protein
LRRSIRSAASGRTGRTSCNDSTCSVRSTTPGSSCRRRWSGKPCGSMS